MRKKVLYFLIITVCFLIAKTNALASTRSELIAKSPSDGAILVCSYTNGTASVEIYDELIMTDEAWKAAGYASSGNWRDYEFWNVFYDTDSINWDSNIGGGSSKGGGTYSGVFGSEIYYDTKGKLFNSSAPVKENNFVCPKYVHLNYKFFWEMCFTDGTGCIGDVWSEDQGSGEISQNSSAKTIFKLIENYAMNGAFDNISSNSLLDGNVVDTVKNNIKTEMNNTYFKSYYMPEYIKKYIDNINENVKLFDSEAYKKLYAEAEKKLEVECQNGTLTESECNQKKSDLLETHNEIYSSSYSIHGVKDPSQGDDCKSVLTAEMTEVVQNILSLIKYLGPILVFIFTALDLFKAVGSGDSKDMQTAWKHFKKRLIAAVILFFIPILINTIFEIAGITAPSTCLK